MEEILAHIIVWLILFGLVIGIWAVAVQELLKAFKLTKGNKK